MKLLINGSEQHSECRTLADLLDALDHPQDAVATAVNQEFVARDARADLLLEAGDAVEIIAPMSGG